MLMVVHAGHTICSRIRSIMVSAVFLGGPHDGLEMEIPDEYAEYRFAQLREPQRVPPMRADPFAPTSVEESYPYVSYKKTRRVLRGRLVYSLVVKR
jgi:hypothetical protein